jgi:hypothetical protein
VETPLEPREIDCHVHGGLERREGLEFALAALAHDGRRAVGILDHVELYLERPPGWAELALAESSRRIDEPTLVDLFRKRLRGPGVFYRQVRDAIERFTGEMRVAVGIEISGVSLEKRLVPPEWLDGAEFIGICTTQPKPGAAWGAHLARLVHLADELRGGRELGLVLHHPFRWRLLELARERPREMPEAAGFTRRDAEAAAEALGKAGGLAEVNYASYFHLRSRSDILRAANEAFILLRDAGVTFSLGSDVHWISSPSFEYRPGEALDAFGVGAEDLRLPKPLDEPAGTAVHTDHAEGAENV